MDQLLSPGLSYIFNDNILPSPTANLFEKNIGALINNFKSNFSDELSMPALNYTSEKLPFVSKTYSQLNQDPFDNMTMFDNLDPFQQEQSLKNPQVEFIVNSFLHDSLALQPQHFPLFTNQFQHSFNDTMMNTFNPQKQNFFQENIHQSLMLQGKNKVKGNAGQRKQKSHTFHNDQYQQEYNPQSQSNNKSPKQLNKSPQLQHLQTQMQKQQIQTKLKQKLFQCPQCVSMFGRMHDLKRHLYVHDNNKPFNCQYCKKGFSRRDALKRHEKNIEDGTKKNCAERTLAEKEVVYGYENRDGNVNVNQMEMGSIDRFAGMEEMGDFGYTNSGLINERAINSKTNFVQFGGKGTFDVFANQVGSYEGFQL